MSAKETFKRYLVFIISLFISAMGVAITKHGELGVSPISSVANIFSIKFGFLTLGNWLIIWNCILILGQILILRKKFNWIQLLQIPLSFLFGYFTDFGMWLVRNIPADTLPLRLLMVFIGTIVLGFGIMLSVEAAVIMNSGEAFVKAISDTIHKEFGLVKIAFDVTCVVIAVALSLIFFHMKIYGTGIGTIIAAILTGIVVRLFKKMFSDRVQAIF